MIFRRAFSPGAFPPWGARPGGTREKRPGRLTKPINPAPMRAVESTGDPRRRRVWRVRIRRRAESGFTLLEMLLVLGLVVVMGAIVLPALNGPLAHQRLNSAAKELRAELTRL